MAAGLSVINDIRDRLASILSAVRINGVQPLILRANPLTVGAGAKQPTIYIPTFHELGIVQGSSDSNVVEVTGSISIELPSSGNNERDENAIGIAGNEVIKTLENADTQPRRFFGMGDLGVIYALASTEEADFSEFGSVGLVVVLSLSLYIRTDARSDTP